MCGCVDILQDLMCGCVDMLQDLMCGWPYCRIIICTFEGTFERRYYEGMLYSEFQPACLGRGNKFAKFTGWWRSHIEYHIHPNFFSTLGTLEGTFEGTKVTFIRLLIGRELDHLQKSQTKQPYGRLLLLYCWLTTMCDASRVLSTATVLRDVLIVALGVHVVVVLTRTPLVNEESTPRRLLMRRW